MKRSLATMALCLVPVAATLMSAQTAGAGRGIRPHEPAGKYMTGLVKDKLEGDYALAWRSLYPRHQRVATLEAYVGCESLIPRPGTLAGVKVLRVFGERIQIAGEPRKLKTRAVRIRVAVASPAFPLFPVTIVQTFHALAVQGQWRWILSANQYAYYRAGTCPYG